jgi:hypothetical protein
MAIFEDFISLKEAGEISGYHPDYIGALVRSGQVTGTKKGNRWTVSKSEIQEHFLKKHYAPAVDVFFSKDRLVRLAVKLGIFVSILVVGFLIFYFFSTDPSGARATATGEIKGVKSSLTETVAPQTDDINP